MLLTWRGCVCVGKWRTPWIRLPPACTNEMQSTLARFSARRFSPVSFWQIQICRNFRLTLLDTNIAGPFLNVPFFFSMNCFVRTLWQKQQHLFWMRKISNSIQPICSPPLYENGVTNLSHLLICDFKIFPNFASTHLWLPDRDTCQIDSGNLL
jgi:hypothetical protein